MNAAAHLVLPRAFRIVAVLGLLTAPALVAQNLLPNPGFEDGTNGPAGWRIGNGGGEWITSAAAMVTGNWTTNAHTGQRAIAVTGDGKNSFAWRTGNLKLQPGGVYRLRFTGRRDAGTSGGCDITGLSRVNRDFHFGESWQPESFVFSVPEDGTNDFLRLGQWEVKGRVSYDDVELLPVQVAHYSAFGSTGFMVSLGAGETIEKGIYRFQPNFGWEGANCHRPLWRNRASFNSDRWVFSPGAEVIYRFALPGVVQSNASVRINVNHYTAGALTVEASQDGQVWQPVGTFDGQRRAGTKSLPLSLFPATEVFVRLSLAGREGNLQVNGCDYEATIGCPQMPDQIERHITGSSQFIEILESSPEIATDARKLSTLQGGGFVRWMFRATNHASGPRFITTKINFPGMTTNEWSYQRALVRPGDGATFCPSGYATKPGRHAVELTIADDAGKTLLRARNEAFVGFLRDPRPGGMISRPGEIGVWWCEGGWKLANTFHWPTLRDMKQSQAILVSAARGEVEPAQLFLSPLSAGSLDSVKVADFKSVSGVKAPIRLRLDEVTYVKVTRPTDATAEADAYPDPLPPLKLPRRFSSYQSLPLWLTFDIPRDTPAGDYTSELELKVDTDTIRVPLAVHVYDFELPRETHLKSALGLGTHDISRYHALTNREQREAVYEKYLQNFAEHRISPYSFFDYAPIDIRFTGEGTNKRAVVDFTRFDVAAKKWLDEQHLSTFQLPLRGMGGGTFQSRSLGSLEGFKEGTPEFARLFQDYLSQIEKHLRERGWLDKAFTYWFDEPDPKDYAFVVDGMKRIRAAAPGIRRMLTEQPEKELMGNVEIWCGLTPEWTPEKVKARRDAGEEVWWYICCAPKAPYVTEFIDHPGTELRLWPWQSWQYGVQGILIWATTYWNSTAAFPLPKLQDPWADPMSYVSGYDFKPGHIDYWGNGDGRFLYPPKRDYLNDKTPCLDGPVNSIRWENLRDGMEDYEYFWLLDQAVKKAEKAGTHRELLAEARGLLKVPEEISKDLTHFTTDPRLMLAHRDKIARMIERLQK